MNDDAPLWAQEVIRSVGRIEGKLDAFNGTFANHVVDNKIVADKVQDIQLGLAQYRGALKVWGAMATVAASGVAGGLHFVGKKFGW